MFSIGLTFLTDLNLTVANQVPDASVVPAVECPAVKQLSDLSLRVLLGCEFLQHDHALEHVSVHILFLLTK